MNSPATARRDQCEESESLRFARVIRASSAGRRSGFLLRHLLLFVFPIAILAQDKVVTPAPGGIPAEHADDAPLAFPPLEHYAKLWENSMFTTKALPPPDDAPKGPVFTDSLTLVGMYEVDGAMVGVLLDKTSSGVMEVRIGAENESGIKIVKVNPGTTPEKTRLQLMKGQEAGWVTFASDAAPPADQGGPGAPAAPGTMPGQQGGMSPPMQQGSVIPGRPANVPQPNRTANGPRALLPPVNQQTPQMPATPPQGAQPPAVQAVPPPVQNVPAPAGGAADGDIPLPPQ